MWIFVVVCDDDDVDFGVGVELGECGECFGYVFVVLYGGVCGVEVYLWLV